MTEFCQGKLQTQPLARTYVHPVMERADSDEDYGMTTIAPSRN